MDSSSLPRPPGLAVHAYQESSERPSLIDYALQPAFLLSYIILDFTLVRLLLASFLLPAYLALAFIRSVLLPGLLNAHLLLTQVGRAELILRGKANRRQRREIGEKQLSGSFRFGEKNAIRSADCREVRSRAENLWKTTRQYVEVCPGLRAAVVRQGPAQGPKVVLLHGNPSWSYMYRHVIPVLVEQGFEVFAPDFIGFGMSDKPLARDQISFELQIRVLIRVFDEFNLRDAHILAHDWGGCVALCGLPHLPSGVCKSLMLLNSFFPPRASEISLNCRALYALWFSSQGILNGLLPEELIIRYMAPRVTSRVASGYAAPFSGPKSKQGVSRFALIVPGMPDMIYRLFESRLGLMVDGLCPPQSFSSLHEQLRLRERGHKVRRFWADGKAEADVAVVLGRSDPLLRDYYHILLGCVNTSQGRAKGIWIEGAGHYATEEKPQTVADLFAGFAQTGRLEKTF